MRDNQLMKNTALIAIDWGTTNLRAYLLGSNTEILDTIKCAMGISKVHPPEFPHVFTKITHKWQQEKKLPVVISGMVGSRNGWVDVNYLPCPANLELLAKHLMRPTNSTEAPFIVPGVSFKTSQTEDVMRGEETEIFGALNPNTTVYCLPGTHSKWVHTQNNSIIKFTTYLSGELFQILSKHSLLKKSCRGTLESNSEFLNGVEQAKNKKGLLANLFNIRSKVLHQRLPAENSKEFLSGLIIGSELLHSRSYWENETQVTLIAEVKIATRYQLALQHLQKDAVILPSSLAVTQGLWKIAKLAQLI